MPRISRIKILIITFIFIDSEYQKLNDVSEDVFGETLPEKTENTIDLAEFMDQFLDPTNGFDKQYPDEYNTVSDVDERSNNT